MIPCPKVGIIGSQDMRNSNMLCSNVEKLTKLLEKLNVY